MEQRDTEVAARDSRSSERHHGELRQGEGEQRQGVQGGPKATVLERLDAPNLAPGWSKTASFDRQPNTVPLPLPAVPPGQKEADRMASVDESLEVIHAAIRAMASRSRIDFSASIPSQHGGVKHCWSDVTAAVVELKDSISPTDDPHAHSASEDEVHNYLPLIHRLLQRLLPLLRHPAPSHISPKHNPVPVLLECLRLYLKVPHDAAPYLDSPLRVLFAAVLPRWLRQEASAIAIITFAAEMNAQICTSHPYLLRQCVPILLKTLAIYPVKLQPAFCHLLPALLPSSTASFSPSFSPSSSPTSLLLLTSHILDLPLLSLNLHSSTAEVSANLLPEEQEGQAAGQATMEEVLALLDEGFTGFAGESEGEGEEEEEERGRGRMPIAAATASTAQVDSSSWLGRSASSAGGGLIGKHKGKGGRAAGESAGEAAARRLIGAITGDRVEVDSMGFAVLAREWREEGVDEALRGEGRHCVDSWRQAQQQQEKQAAGKGTKSPAKEKTPPQLVPELHKNNDNIDHSHASEQGNCFLGALRVAPRLLAELCRLLEACEKSDRLQVLHLPAFLYLLLLRCSHLFPSPPYQRRVRECILAAVTAFLTQRPELMLQLRGIVASSISATPLLSPSRCQLSMHLCHLVGDVLPGVLGDPGGRIGDTLGAAASLFDALEVALFETLTAGTDDSSRTSSGDGIGRGPFAVGSVLLKWDNTKEELTSGQNPSHKLVQKSQLVQCLALALARIGAACWTFRSRAEVCLAKVSRSGTLLHPFVCTQAGDLLLALKQSDGESSLLFNHSNESETSSISHLLLQHRSLPSHEFDLCSLVK